jgi:hypothetical protein
VRFREDRRSDLESSPGEQRWLCGPPHIGQELCRDYVLDLFDASWNLHLNYGNGNFWHFVSRKIRIAIKTVLAGH